MKTVHLVLLFAAVAVFLFLFTGPARMKGLSRGFYTADFTEYNYTPDWYVASNTPLRSGTA